MASEFTLIERFLKPFAMEGEAVAFGPGDDCALLRERAGLELCVTTDAVVEGVHFDLATFTDEEIGHKALAVNLSDLAAMGAKPAWFLCSVALKPDQTPRLAGIARGMAKLARAVGIPLVGGNFSRAGELSLHLTVAGEVRRGKALRRDGAKPGDRLYVTGTLGDAALALELGQTRRKLGERQRRPAPRIAEGQAAARLAHAAIDLSDGLVQDARHLADASRVQLVIDAAKLPLSSAFRRAGGATRHALAGGEDYELLFAVPERRARDFEKAFAGSQATLIGEVRAGAGLVLENAPRLDRGGHDHFGGDVRPVR